MVLHSVLCSYGVASIHFDRSASSTDNCRGGCSGNQPAVHTLEHPCLDCRSNGPDGGSNVPDGRGSDKFEFHTAPACFSTIGVRYSGTRGVAHRSSMVLAYMQRKARSCSDASGHPTFLRVAQPVVLLLLRGLSALHSAGGASIFREEQKNRTGRESTRALAVRPS